jgi:hypothetical protein
MKELFQKHGGRTMQPKSLNDLATKLEHVGLNLPELEEFAVRSYLNAQAWKGAFLGLALVNLLILISCIAFN